MDLSSRLAWFKWLVPGQPELHRKTSQKPRKETPQGSLPSSQLGKGKRLVSRRQPEQKTRGQGYRDFQTILNTQTYPCN